MPYKTKEAAAAAKRKWRAANAEKDKAIRDRERPKALERWREKAKNPEFREKENKRIRLGTWDKKLIRKKSNLKRNYGISIAQYEQMLEDAGYCCEICGKHQRDLKRSLCVDHCHETGKVRGMLCNTCNVALGQIGESNLQTAVDYVKERG